MFFKWLFCHIATTEIINKTGKEIKSELRESLNKLSEGKKDMVVMVYFMGYTRMVGLCHFQVNKLTLTIVAVVNQGRNQLPFFVGLDSSSTYFSNMRGVDALLVVPYNSLKQRRSIQQARRLFFLINAARSQNYLHSSRLEVRAVSHVTVLGTSYQAKLESGITDID